MPKSSPGIPGIPTRPDGAGAAESALQPPPDPNAAVQVPGTARSRGPDFRSRVSTNLHESRSRMRFLGNLTGTKTLKDRLLNPMDLKRYNAN